MNKKKIVGIEKICPKNKNPFYMVYVEFPMTNSNSSGVGVCADKIFVPESKMIQDLKVGDFICVGYNANGFVDFLLKV